MYTQDVFVLSSVALLIGSSLFIGGAVAGGIFTGLISALGLGLILIKVRNHFPKVWKFVLRHPIMTDVVLSSLLAFLLVNNTVTGLVSAAGAGLFVSAGLAYSTKS